MQQNNQVSSIHNIKKKGKEIAHCPLNTHTHNYE